MDLQYAARNDVRERRRVPPFIAELSADVEIDFVRSRRLFLATRGAAALWLIRP